MDLLRGACGPSTGSPWGSGEVGRRLEEELIAALPVGLRSYAYRGEPGPAVETAREEEWGSVLQKLGERHPEAFRGAPAFGRPKAGGEEGQSAGPDPAGPDEAGFVLWMRGKIRNLSRPQGGAPQGSPRLGGGPSSRPNAAPAAGPGDEPEGD